MCDLFPIISYFFLQSFFLVSETKQWQNIACSGVPPSPRDKLTCVAMGTKILFFGGFGPLEETDTSQEGGADFGWFNDLFSFDTGLHHVI